jgi:hypothetical protein
MLTDSGVLLTLSFNVDDKLTTSEAAPIRNERATLLGDSY